MMTALSLRQRNRLSTMRDVQEMAMATFEDQGFEGATVEQIAELAGASASTVYRHFGSKENLVLWDERDTIIDDEFVKLLRHFSPELAFRGAVISALADRPDKEMFLRRLKLVYSVSSIWGVAAQEDRVARDELASAIAGTQGRAEALVGDRVIAATCLAAIDVALDSWQRSNGTIDLEQLIVQSFAIASPATAGH
jgi:AcrR family transcriptional regulator